MGLVPWATVEDVRAPCDCVDPDLLAKTLGMATSVLYNLTRRRWPGVQTDTIRPQSRYRADPNPRWWPGTDTAPWGWCSCHRERVTGCSSISEVRLPGHPVVVDDEHPIEVTLDGDPFLDFRLDDGRFLARIDGNGWPCCQVLRRSVDEVGTFQITYSYGGAPPAGGDLAAAALACQYALAFDPDAVRDGRCRLPRRVTTVTRGGTTIAVIDPMTLVKDGLVGLAEIDQWVAAQNIGIARRRGTVMVAGRGRASRRSA